MRALARLMALCLLVCVLVLSLPACSLHPAGESALPNSAPVPSQPAASAVPTVQVPPNDSPALFGSSGPEPSGSTPALLPDEETTLTYVVNDEAVTVPALKHSSPFGYSIVYDTERYVCNAFSDGESYWADEGNYLSVSLIPGMPVEDALAGLRLQQNIAMEPEMVLIGAGYYSAYTVYFTTDSGLYRQFWVLPCGEDALLVEQSFDTFGVDAAAQQACQLLMLSTLTTLY